MTSQSAMRQCFDAVTSAPAKVMHLQGYGLQAGGYADFVLLQARDPVEAIRLRATRLAVYRRGRRIAATAPAIAALALPTRPAGIDFLAAQ
jgi:cytosine deaminase